MEPSLVRKAWCSVAANEVERDQIDEAAKISKKPRAVWMRETLVAEAINVMGRARKAAQKTAGKAVRGAK